MKSSKKFDPSLIAPSVWDECCRRNPLYWAQNWTLTENPKYLEQGLQWKAPFPRKSYFVPLFNALKAQKRVFFPKTREMLTSWAVMIYATHQAQWFKAEAIVQTESESKAMELLGYAQCLHRNQAPFLKERHKLKREPSQLEIEWESGGRILGIPKGENKIRMFHPTIYIMDEAAFLPEAEACYNASQPVAGQIIAVSSAGPGWFGNECTI